MAKRFIDTGFFDSPSIRRLPTLYKLFWLYLFTNCDHAGIWCVDFQKASFMCGGKIKKEFAMEKMKKKYIEIDNGKRWFLPGFILFQYPKGLNPKNKAHESVLNILRSYGVTASLAPTLAPTLAPLYAPQIAPTLGGKDMVMDLDKDLGMEKVKEMATKILERLNKITKRNYPANGPAFQNIVNNLINGKTVDQHFHIIEIKQYDPYFIENPHHFNPNTLFGGKFDIYANQRIEDFRKKEKSSTQQVDNPDDYFE